jgi:hypothetical protein
MGYQEQKDSSKSRVDGYPLVATSGEVWFMCKVSDMHFSGRCILLGKHNRNQAVSEKTLILEIPLLG